MIKPQHELLNYHTLPVQAPGRSSNHRCRSWVTSDRVESAAGPAMSASHPKRPSAEKMRSVVKGQEETSTDLSSGAQTLSSPESFDYFVTVSL